MKQLILNADDFGLTRGVNQGIIRGHREGILTSATIMANGPAFDEAAELAGANPTLGIGCHLVLVGGMAVAPPAEVPSLADEGGRLPASLAKLVARISSGAICGSDIEREFRAQIRKIREAGIEPTHLDTHKHAHAHPVVLEALARVAREAAIRRVRRPVERLRNSWRTARQNGNGWVKQFAGAAVLHAAAPSFRAITRKYRLSSPDNFLGLAATGHAGPELLREMIERLPDGCTEIMLHPGICDQDLARTGSRLQRHREDELRALLDASVRERVAACGVRLISYRELN